MSRIVAPLFVLVLFPMWSGALAQTCTAYLNATDGDDANSGSITSPLRSVEYAYNSLPGNSEVCIAAGEYFYGDDADGISLAIPEKGMSFVLNAFAGEDEIRFSESHFIVDVGSASIEFKAGTSSDLVIGTGIANVNDPDLPQLLNFVHTVALVSGSVDVSGISLVLEESVGNPEFVNALNPVKTAPSDSRIEFADVDVFGAPIYANASRTYVFSSSVARFLDYPLPPDLENNRFSFLNTASLQVTDVIDFGESTILFGAPGALLFENDVIIDPSSGPVEITPTSSDVVFGTVLKFEAASAPDELIHHGSNGVFSINQLDLVYEGLTEDELSRILIDGNGSFSVGLVTSQASQAGFEFIVDFEIDSGELIIGGNGVDVSLPGALINRDRVILRSSVQLGEPPGGTALQNSGSIDLATHVLTDSGSSFARSNDGDISGISGSGLSISGTSTWTGAGTLPDVLISGTLNLGGSIGVSGSINVENSAAIDVQLDAQINVLGGLSSSGSSGITLGSNSSISVTGNVDLLDGVLALEEASSLLIGGDINLGSTSVFDTNGQFVFFGTGTKTITGNGSISVPRLVIAESDVELNVSSTINGLAITGGGLAVFNSSDLTVTGETSISSGYIRTPFASSIEFNDSVIVSEAVANFNGASTIRINSDMNWGSSSVTFPSSGITASGGSRIILTPPADYVLPRLILEDPTTEVIISGHVAINHDLILEEGTLTIADGSTVKLLGGLSGSGGVLRGLGECKLYLQSDSEITITGFDTFVLPSIIIDGPIVSTDSDLSVTGSISVVDGGVRVVNGSTLEIGEGFSLDAGIATVSSLSVLRILGPSVLTAGMFTVTPDAVVEFGDSLTATDTELNLAGASVMFVGGRNQLVSLKNPISFGDFGSTNTGTNVTFVQPTPIQVTNSFSVAGGTSVELVDNVIELTGDGSSPILHVDGIVKSGSGSFLFTGPGSAISKHTLSGSGVFGSMHINLDDDTDNVIVAGPNPSLRFSGEVFFESGSIDAAGKSIVPSTIQMVPQIRINLSDEVGLPGRIDGGRFFDSTGDLVYNPSAVQYNLAYTGSLEKIYVIGPEFQPDVTRDLVIDAVDLVNDPPSLGIQLNSDAAIQGSLVISGRARLILNASDLTLSRSLVTHNLDGSTVGNGDLVITGNSSVLTSQANTGSVQSLRINNTSEQDPISILGINSINDLVVQGGALIISPPGPNRSALRIADSFTALGGMSTVFSPLTVGTNDSSGIMDIRAGVLQINDGVDVLLESGSQFTASQNATISVYSIAGQNLSSNGFIVFLGGGTLSALSPIPRLRLDASAPGLLSDDIELSTDVRISDIMDWRAGDLMLGSHTLSIENGQVLYHPIDSPLDEQNSFFGIGPQAPGVFLVAGASELHLRDHLALNHVSMRVGNTAQDEFRLTSDSKDPVSITLDTQALRVQAGTLDLGLSDIILAGTTPGLLTVESTGRIVASALPIAPSKRGKSGTTPEQFPADDNRYGEIVFTGSGNAGISNYGTSTITNLTIDGTTRLSADSNPLSIAGRLAFGRNGAVFILDDPDRLVLKDNSVLLRRGAGTLSHVPFSEGVYDVFYDLDDGSHSGIDSGFGPGTLVTDLELQADPSSIGYLGVFAGARGSIVNTLVINEDIQINEGFALFGGNVDLSSDPIMLAPGATYTIDEIDSEAPISFGPGFQLSSAGLIDLDLIYRHRDVSLSDNLIPPDIPIDTLFVFAGDVETNRDIVMTLHRPISAAHFLFDAVSTTSALELDGNDLTADSSFELARGTIRSSSDARVQSNGSFTATAGSVLSGLMELDVNGATIVAGASMPPDVNLSGNIFLNGADLSETVLILDGSEQNLTSSGPISVSSLEMSQQGAGATLTLVAQGAPFDVFIEDNLTLKSGVITTSDNRIVLPGSPGGLTQDVQPLARSHVSGNIGRAIAAGSTDTILFPTGDQDAYRPVWIELNGPLDVANTIFVNHIGARPVGMLGLPLEIIGGDSIRSVLDHSWTLSSALPVSASQSFNIASVIDYPGNGSPESFRLLARRDGGLQYAWTTLPGNNSSLIDGTSLRLRSENVQGLFLSPGASVAIGSPVAPGGIAEFQIINGLEFAGGGSVDFLLSNQAFFSNSSVNTASNSVPVETFLDERHVSVSVRSAADGSSIWDGLIQVDSGSRSVAVLAQNELGEPQVLSTQVDLNSGPPSGQTGIGFVNASPDFPIDAVYLGDTGSPSFTDAEAPSIFSPVISEPQNLNISFDQSVVLDFNDTYRFDFSGLERQVSFLLHSGFLNPPPSLEQPVPVSLWVVLPDGSVLPTVPITDIEDASAELPRSFKLRGNYPNPFNPSTTILFDLPQAANISVRIVDILGRVVARLEGGFIPAGNGRTILFDASHLGSGTYLYQLVADTGASREVSSGKMVLLK